jgi:hypothetical protein
MALVFVEGCTEAPCELGEAPDVRFSWALGEFQPPPLDISESIGPRVDCEVLDTSGGTSQIDLRLECTVDGAVVPEQHFTISPTPAVLVEAVDRGDALAVGYRPRESCSNGCNWTEGGWVAIRRAADDELLVATVAAVNEQGPVAELFSPLTIGVEDSGCPRVHDGCDMQPGWEQPLDVVVEVGGETATVTGRGETDVGAYHVIVLRAQDGAHDGCTFDAGARASVRLLVERRP